MSSALEPSTNGQTRTYDRARSVVFLKTDGPFGGLSNMAGGFPLQVRGTRIFTSEALYQACRFPHMPEIQRLVIEQASPMTAKMKSKPYRKDSRPDWARVRVKVMRWCLRVKLAQNWGKFSELLLRTDDQPIVEESRRDEFWGAKSADEQTLVGMNVLGRLLMELREAVKSQDRAALQTVEPLDIPEFLLLGRPIGTLAERELGARDMAAPVTARAPDNGRLEAPAEQASLFDTPAAEEPRARACIASPPPTCTPIDNLKPYPATKDSGVPWLREMPAHWEIRRLKYLLRERDVRSAAGTEQLLRVSQFTGVTERRRADGGDEPDTRAESLVGYKLVKPKDLVVNIMLAWNGSMGVSRFSGIASPAYCVYRFSASALPWYFHHLLRSPAYKARIKAVSTGVVESRLRLYSDDLFRLQGLLPPLPEQAAIVRFLDHADRRIRRYIRAKQKLIKLLEEQKQAIIQRTVSRGVDPNVRLKRSGVEWLGDVPEHWEILTLRRVISRAVDGPHHSPNYLDSGIPFLSARNIKVDHWSLDDAKFISEEDYAEFSKRITPEVGDVLYTKGGTTGVARVVDLPYRFQVWVHVAVLKPKRHKVVPNYLALLLNSPRCYEQAQLFTRGATNQDLGLGRMKGIVFALPPLSEQETLLAAVEKETQNLRMAVDDARREIELLREYRTRLIADVVTGKLDVREAAGRLPDEIEELEPFVDTETESNTDEAGAGDADEMREEAEV